MRLQVILLLILSINFSCNYTPKNDNSYSIPGEFEDQEYIWFSWKENGFLGGAPFYTTIIDAIEAIHHDTKIKLLYGPQLEFNKIQMQKRIWDVLINRGFDTSRIELFYNEKAFGAIQDPGPIFLRSKNGELAVADFKYLHPDKRSEAIDRNVAEQMNLPYISSKMVSEGGAWQTNGAGTMLAVEAVELDRNKGMSKQQIEKEYKRVLGVNKIIWLKQGLKEEEWGLLEDGKYGIGTGGHIDEFCRFVNPTTVLLAEIPAKDTVKNKILKTSFERMEENLRILQQSTTHDGKPFKIIRLPNGPAMTKKVNFHSLSPEEKSWFENFEGDSVEFYLTTGYMNFVISNGVVVTGKFWKEGLSLELHALDNQAKKILESAFPNRKIVQIDCMPLHHDGAGIHCHSRNQPVAHNDNAISNHR